MSARTLSDIYAERPLTEQQARRIVALLGLAGQATTTRGRAGIAVPNPPAESAPHQAAS